MVFDMKNEERWKKDLNHSNCKQYPLIIKVNLVSADNKKYKIIKKGKVWTPNPEGKHGGDVWNIPTLAGRRFRDEKVEHPTQKPLALCNKIIKHFSNEGDLVLIPFCGSGSECISAIKTKRDYIAFEANKEYVKLSSKRIKESTTESKKRSVKGGEI